MQYVKCDNEEKDFHTYELSDIDKSILTYIQNNGRASFRQISKDLNMSVSTVSKHVEDLQKDGIIKDFIAVLDCCKIGYKEMILLFIKANTSVSIDKILCNLKQIPEINAIYQVSGSLPIFCMAKCVEKQDQISLLEKIKRIEGIEDITTHIVLQKAKEDMRITIP